MKKIILLVVLNFSIQFVSAQNSCATATAITTAGSYVVSSIVPGTIPSPICPGNSSTAALTGSRWYAYTPTQNYTVTVTSDLAANVTANPNGDTQFNVYTGACGALACLANDDDGGVLGNGYLSTATFNVIANTTYRIAWDNRWSSVGFTFNLIQNPLVNPLFTSQTINTITTGTNIFNICSVDMNGDYRDDLVNISSTNIKVHYQNANGTFTVTDIPTTSADFLPTWSAAAGDYNKDGINDLLYGNGNGVTFMRSNAAGTAFTEFSTPEYVFSQRSNFIDINNDGNLDAFVCHDVDPNVYYLNDGSGNLSFRQSGVSGAYNLGLSAAGGNYGSIWIDYDNDRDLDLFIAKCGSVPPDELHRNNGNGTYSDISVAMNLYDAGQSWSSAWADFDNDGDMDVLVGASAGAHVLKRNDLNTANSVEEPFVDITSGSGWDTNSSTNIEHIAHDFDNDGKVDVLGGGNKIMFNQGNNVFAPVTIPGLIVGAVGDFNNDGFLDIQNGNTLKINGANTNNWIKIQLKGVQSNSNGIGARVEIYGAFGKQIRDVRSGDGFKYMSSLNVHFGIGQATAITKVVIMWPSGTVDTIDNPTIDQNLLVVEGSTLSANLKLFIEGYYDSASTMKSVKFNQDTVSPTTDVEEITVELHSTTPPHNTVASATAMLKTNGTAKCRFPTAPSGSYYIALKSSNGIQTWSKTPQTIGRFPLEYDFSNAAGKAFGDNLIDLGSGVFGIYSGDVNQDESIDGTDSPAVLNDIENSAFGVQVTDLNGDGAVDGSDIPVLDNNAGNSIFANRP